MSLLDYLSAILDWCKTKTALHAREKPRILFKEGEIWWCSIGMNVGVEIFGKGNGFTRPVLILKKFDAGSFLAIPLTSQAKQGSWYAPVRYGTKQNTANLAQIRTLDARRLIKRIGTIGPQNFQAVKEAFRLLFP